MVAAASTLTLSNTGRGCELPSSGYDGRATPVPKYLIKERYRERESSTPNSLRTHSAAPPGPG